MEVKAVVALGSSTNVNVIGIPVENEVVLPVKKYCCVYVEYLSSRVIEEVELEGEDDEDLIVEEEREEDDRVEVGLVLILELIILGCNVDKVLLIDFVEECDVVVLFL